MKKQWTHIDKSGWGDGPWQNEPDKKQWTDKTTGLDCLAVRHERSGHWCGYVGVPEGHPWFGKSYHDVNPDVHGGLTFSDKCHPSEKGEGHGVCHVSDHEVFWLGFDCAHCDDYSPGNRGKLDIGEEYRDLHYVERECKKLAAQIKAQA